MLKLMHHELYLIHLGLILVAVGKLLWLITVAVVVPMAVLG